MKIKKNFWRDGKALWIQIIAFAVAVMLYSVCCYPIYTSSKARIMRQLYEDIHDMDLEELSEDDEETLGDYQKEKFETVIANENYEQIYTSRSSLKTTHARKYIENKIAQYTEEGTLEQRRMESRHILMFRGKIIQDGHTFYVYLRKDVQSVLEVIEGTRLYLAVVLLLMMGLSYFLEKMSKASTEKKAKQSDYQLLESQREFVANISHELKTPVTELNATLENMILGIGEYRDYETYLPKCKEITEQLGDMIRDILNASRLQTQGNNEPCSNFSLRTLLTELCEPYRLIAEAKGIKFKIELSSDAFVYLPEGRLKKAISNILSNAVNYTEAGQSISVVFDKNKLSVSNECSVLPPEQLQHIFEPFYRPDLAHSQATGGNGLGLYIVQTILDKLRLKYQFVPMPNDRGMSFTIQF